MPTTEGKLCDWEVYGLALSAVPKVKAKWAEIGRPWNVKDEAMLAQILVALAFQESAIDKSGPPYCGFDPKASTKKSSAKGLMQFVKTTWGDVQERIIKLPVSERRPLEDRYDPVFSMFLGACYLVEMYDYKKSYNWRMACKRYHDGYGGNYGGEGYAKLILDKWRPMFDWTRLATQVASGASQIVMIENNSRKEFQ